MQLRRLALGALLLASFLLPPVAARASLTTVGQVSVIGTTLLDPEAVIAAANIPIGSSLLGVNLREAEEAVAALPLVASVRVSALLLDWTSSMRFSKALGSPLAVLEMSPPLTPSLP